MKLITIIMSQVILMTGILFAIASFITPIMGLFSVGYIILGSVGMYKSAQIKEVKNDKSDT